MTTQGQGIRAQCEPQTGKPQRKGDQSACHRERSGSSWTGLGQREKAGEGIPMRGPDPAKAGLESRFVSALEIRRAMTAELVSNSQR